MSTPPDTSEPHQLGRRITDRRRELSMSRADLVDASGLSYPYISQLETGRRTPSRKSVARLAEALDLEADALDSLIAIDETPVASTTSARRGMKRDHWQPNPVFAAASAPTPKTAADRGRGRSSRSPRSTEEALELVLHTIAPLSPRQRLEVLTEAQRLTIDDM